jgi:SAM-dependent methyltransferase
LHEKTRVWVDKAKRQNAGRVVSGAGFDVVSSRRAGFELFEELRGSFGFRGKRVLDAGCGGLARFTIPLALEAECVVAFDVVFEAVCEAREAVARVGLSNVVFVQGDLCEELPFANDFFDVVFCVGVVYHLPSKVFVRGCLSEFNRVLKPGGVLVINFANKYYYRNFPFMAYRWLYERVRGTHPVAFDYYSLGFSRGLLCSAGFVGVRVVFSNESSDFFIAKKPGAGEE